MKVICINNCGDCPLSGTCYFVGNDEIMPSDCPLDDMPMTIHDIPRRIIPMDYKEIIDPDTGRIVKIPVVPPLTVEDFSEDNEI